MKLKTSIRAGAQGCSPEAQYYMQKALAVESKIANCLANQRGTTPPYYGYYPDYPPVNNPVYPPYVGSTYPDRSGWCG